MEAIRGEKTLSQLSSQFKVHPAFKSRSGESPQLSNFVDGRTRKGAAVETGNDALSEEIGRLKVELDWRKENWHARLRICAC